MKDLEFALPNPSKNTLIRCNELLLVYTFKTMSNKIRPEFVEKFISINALVFGISEKDVSTIFSLIKTDITMFTMKEICVCAYYLSKYGIKPKEILCLFNIKSQKYITTLKMYYSYDNCDDLQPKIAEETLKNLNGLLIKLNGFSENVLRTNKILNKFGE